MAQRFTAEQVCDQILSSLDDGSDDEAVREQIIDDDDSEENNSFSIVSDNSDPEYEPDTTEEISSEDDSDYDGEAANQSEPAQVPTDEAESYTSKNGLVWLSADPPSSRTRGCNICHTTEGPCGKAKLILTESDALSCFLDDDILHKVIQNTNQYARMYMVSKGRDPSTWKRVDETEMKAVIGVLYLLGVYRSQHESLRSLWSSGHSGRPIFKAAFSINRFEQIVSFMRFDDRDTRQVRKINDKFAPFRSLWNAFNENCRKNYNVGPYVTIDEQLIPFRGRCSFRQYMPKKPDKYAMKLFLMCDVATAYTFNGLPYAGREGDQRCTGLAESVVKKLVEPILNSGVNVTTDNWFTSAKLAADLLCKHITLLGTMRKNKPEIPSVRGDLWDQACLVFAKSKPWCPMCQKETRPL